MKLFSIINMKKVFDLTQLRGPSDGKMVSEEFIFFGGCFIWIAQAQLKLFVTYTYISLSVKLTSLFIKYIVFLKEPWSRRG